MERAPSAGSPSPGVLLAVLALGISAYATLQSLVVPALPTLQKQLNTTPTGAAWIFTAYLVSASVATPLAGRLGDMFGKKRMLVVVLTGLSAGIAVSALATTLPVMLAGRVIQGMGGALFPLAFGIIRDEFPRERVAGGIGLVSGLLGIGGGLGLVLGGSILAHLDYHWLFWIPMIATVVATIATVVIVPESPVRAPGMIDWRGAVLLSAWPICLLVAISQAPTWGWASAPTLGLFVAAVVLAAVWVRVELRTRVALVDMQMMRLRAVWTMNLAGFMLGIGMYSSFVLIPQFVQTAPSNGYGFGSSVTQAGLFLVPSTVTMLVFSPIGGRLAGRVGPKVPLLIGFAIDLATFAFLSVAHSNPWQFYTASLMLGAGHAFAFAGMANMIVGAVRQDETGIATGMNFVMRTIGGAIGAQVAATILAANLLADGVPAEEGYIVSFLVMAGAFAAALAASLAAPAGQPAARGVIGTAARA